MDFSRNSLYLPGRFLIFVRRCLTVYVLSPINDALLNSSLLCIKGWAKIFLVSDYGVPMDLQKGDQIQELDLSPAKSYLLDW